jgi:hypothetical protein
MCKFEWNYFLGGRTDFHVKVGCVNDIGQQQLMRQKQIILKQVQNTYFFGVLLVHPYITTVLSIK